ncbi:HEPN domain-containing protein [hot springs metagenome]|uniref:HEPN domain-containing protein n=1 Tax=hot springs metagenome TaxID=433727 RepID=A0A5J4L3W1_9ZZZZ
MAETLFKSEKYDWCLFIGHLVIEKVLKAFCVRDRGEMPPKVHNLIILAERTNTHLSDEQKQLLGEINRFNIEARYPDYKQDFYRLCTKEFAEEYLQRLRSYIYGCYHRRSYRNS